MVGNTVTLINPFQKEKMEYLFFLSLDICGLVGWWGEVNIK